MGTFSSIKKYSKPSLELDERISYLNSQLVKTGMLSERMTTSALYGGQDEEDTTQNTNTRDPGEGTNENGEPFQGVFGNYQTSGSFTYIKISGQLSSYNRGSSIVLDYVRDGDGNALYAKVRSGTLSGPLLHFKSVSTSSRVIAGLRRWIVNGVTVGGSTVELFVGASGFSSGKNRAGLVDEGPTSVLFWSDNGEQPIPGEIRQKPAWYHFMRRNGSGTDFDPNQKLQDMLKSGLEYMDKKFKQFSAFDMVFKKFETMASVVGLDGAANTLREYGNFLSGRSSYTPEKPKMTNASTEEKKAILKNAEARLFEMGFAPIIDGVRNKYYKPPITEKEKQQARRAIGMALSGSINDETTKDLYYQHGAVSPTFHKSSSNAEGISPDGKGGLNANDGYDFAPKPGQTGTENARVPGPSGDVMELMANAMTAEARLPGSKYAGKSIVDLPRMPIRTTFTKEDLKGTSIGMLLQDLERPTKVQKELNSWDKAIKYLKGA